jgi:hypothetical protein
MVNTTLPFPWGAKSVVYPSKFVVTESAWTRINDLPFSYKKGCVFDFGSKKLISTLGSSANQRVIYSFDPDSRSFILNSGTYTSVIESPYSCVLNGKGYLIGTTSSNTVAMETFNPDSLSWRRLKDFPGTYVTSPVLFADDSVLYAGLGSYSYGSSVNYYLDFWKYSPVNNKWSRLKDCPNTTSGSNIIFISNQLLIYTNYGYMYQYFPLTNTWQNIGMYSMGWSYAGNVSLSYNGYWYLGFGGEKAFYKYDPAAKSVTSLQYPAPSSRAGAICFSTGSYIFIGGNQTGTLNDFWIYDPSKE